MQPGRVEVLTPQGKSGIRVRWQRIGSVDNRTTDRPDKTRPIEESNVTTDFDEVQNRTFGRLPEGMSQDKTDLIIWGAAEEHSGVYEALVYSDEDYSEEAGAPTTEPVARLRIKIRVSPMSEGGAMWLKPSKAGELPDSRDDESVDKKREEPDTEVTPDVTDSPDKTKPMAWD
ncbi:unnamed protein product, partial [Protopolystoma xenopodis]